MEELQKQLQDALARRDFADAEEISKALARQRVLDRSIRLGKLRMKQKQRTTKIEHNFQQQNSEFEAKWNQIFSKYNEEWTQAKTNLHQQVEEDRIRMREQLESKISPIFKPSAEVLQLMKCRDKAADVKRYKEAKLLQREIEEKIEAEKVRFKEKREEKIVSKLKNFQKELVFKANRLDMKYKTLHDELLIEKRKEYQKMEIKFNNIRKSLLNAQRIEENEVGSGAVKEKSRDIHVAMNSSRASRMDMHPQNAVKKYLSQSLGY